MKRLILLPTLVVGALLLAGCDTSAPTTPEPTESTPTSDGTTQNTDVSVEVTGDGDMDAMESMEELSPSEAAKYQADLPLNERIELANDLAMAMPKNGMKQMKVMFPDLSKTKDVGSDDPLNMMNMGPESWFYSTEGDITIAVCNMANTPLHVFTGLNPSEAEVKDAMEMMKEMMDDMHGDDDHAHGDDDHGHGGDEVAVKSAAVYEEYSDAKRTAYNGSEPHVLFFHANWCPICRVMDKNIEEGLADFPEGTKILKADYDKEVALKKEYGVNIQSTIVVLDGGGEVVYKAQDPALDDLKDAINNSMEA